MESQRRPERQFHVALTVILFGLLAANGTLRAQGTVVTGWFNGACLQWGGIPGISNAYVSEQQFSRVYDDFVVPPGGWTVAGLFSYNHMPVAGVTEAIWEVRSGVSLGNGGTVVASGRSPAIQKFTLTWPDRSKLYRLEVDGLRVPLAAGTYWVSVSPVISSIQSYLCATKGSEAVGTPLGNDGRAYFYSNYFENSFFQLVQSTGGAGSSGDYSQGVLITSAAAPAKPVVTALVNAASWQNGPVSPGEIITIGGSGLGPLTQATLMTDERGMVATSLDAVQVLFSGFAAPELYVSGTQINAVVPYELAGMASATVQVMAGGEASNLFPVNVASTGPAIFTADASGKGGAASLNEDNSCNGPGNPAAKGSYLVLYLTGEGQTKPGGVTGKVTTASQLPPLTPQPEPVSVLIDGQAAYVAFYGEAPGTVSGVMQVNVRIPTNVASGDLPVVVSVGGNRSQDGVTISVQ